MLAELPALSATAVGLAFALHQGALQTGAVITVEHRGQHQQRQRILVLGLKLVHALQGGRAIGHGDKGLLGRLLDLDTAHADLPGFGLRLALRQGARRNAAVILLGPGTHLVDVHIPTTTTAALDGTYQRLWKSRTSPGVMESRSLIQPTTGGDRARP